MSDLIDRLRELQCKLQKGWFHANSDEKLVQEAIAALEAIEAEKEMREFIADFAAKQKPLGAEFSKILYDNIEELYITDELPAPPKGEREGK